MDNEKHFDFVVVGGGIIGSSVCYKLIKKYPKSRILLLEKENSISKHQTGRNSGVIHSGLYYKPNSLKAKTCINGYKQLLDFCQEYNVKHEVCGKIVVAKNEKEHVNLLNLIQRGKDNNLSGLKKLDSYEIKQIEPYISGSMGVFVPQTGIVDFVGMSKKLIDYSCSKGLKVKFNFEVIDIKSSPSIITIKGNNSIIKAKKLICCGGLFSDRLALKFHKNIDLKIVPFRGDYYELVENSRHLIRNLVYPVPDPNLPFLGVHFTRMYNGKIECGPNAVFSFKREGYNKTDFNLKDTIDSLTYFGTYKLFYRHFNYGINEYSRAFSKRLFYNALKEYLPSLKITDLKKGRSGVRAQALDKKGNLLDDFKILNSDNIINVINAPSPAATASLSIADKILEYID